MERPVRREPRGKQVSQTTSMTIRSMDSIRALVAESEERRLRSIDHKHMSEGETHRTRRGWSCLAEAVL
jgi:hypothetical protein